MNASQNKRAAPGRRATRDATTHPLHDSTPRPIVEGLTDAGAALGDAWRELRAHGITPTLREHVESAECALGIAIWVIAYSLADRWPS